MLDKHNAAIGVIQSVLEGTDLTLALKRQPQLAHPHIYTKVVSVGGKECQESAINRVAELFGYISTVPSRSEHIDYRLTEELDDSRQRWCVIHELAHTAVGQPKRTSPSGVVLWEWEVSQAQRSIERNLGLNVSHTSVAKDTNSVMFDSVCRAKFNKINEKVMARFTPFEHLVPIDFITDFMRNR